MHLVVLYIGDTKRVISKVHLLECFPGVGYQQFVKMLNALHLQNNVRNFSIPQDELRDFLVLAQTESVNVFSMLFGRPLDFHPKQ